MLSLLTLRETFLSGDDTSRVYGECKVLAWEKNCKETVVNSSKRPKHMRSYKLCDCVRSSLADRGFSKSKLHCAHNAPPQTDTFEETKEKRKRFALDFRISLRFPFLGHIAGLQCAERVPELNNKTQHSICALHILLQYTSMCRSINSFGIC